MQTIETWQGAVSLGLVASGAIAIGVAYATVKSIIRDKISQASYESYQEGIELASAMQHEEEQLARQAYIDSLRQHLKAEKWVPFEGPIGKEALGLPAPRG